MREFERWYPDCGNERKNQSLAGPILAVLRAAGGCACTYENIAQWVSETERVYGFGPRDIRYAMGYARARGLISPEERIWGIWGVGYVCTGVDTPERLNEIGISFFLEDNGSGLILVPGISLLDKGRIEGTKNPSPERIKKVFGALTVVGPKGTASYLRPMVVGVGRKLLAGLVNAGPEGMTAEELIEKSLERNFIQADMHLITTKFSELRKVLGPFGLGIQGKVVRYGRKKLVPGSCQYHLCNL